MITREEFAKVLLAFKRILPQGSPNIDDPSVQEIWFESFKQENIETLRKVYLVAKTRCNQFPTVKQLQEIIDEVNSPIQRDPFNELMTNIRKYGHSPYKWPPQDDMLVRTLNRMGGLERFSRASEDNLEWLRKEFMAHWKELLIHKRSGFYETDKLPEYMGGFKVVRTSYEETLTGKISRDKILALEPPQEEHSGQFFRGGPSSGFKEKWANLKAEVATMKDPPKPEEKPRLKEIRSKELQDLLEQMRKSQNPSSKNQSSIISKLSLVS